MRRGRRRGTVMTTLGDHYFPCAMDIYGGYETKWCSLLHRLALHGILASRKPTLHAIECGYH
eukprot:SM007994S22518  [mRNA]  locus=s7994:449:671:- [translate_table: standard]